MSLSDDIYSTENLFTFYHIHSSFVVWQLVDYRTGN